MRWGKNAASFWFETIALSGCALALEAVALGAWLQLGAAWTTSDPAQALLPSWALLLVLLAAFWLAQWLAAQHLPGRWPALLVVLGWLVALLAAWYLRLYLSSGPFWQGEWLAAIFHDVLTNSGQIIPVISLGFLTGILWWRGIRLGRWRVELEQISRSFKIGFAALALALLLIGTAASSARAALSAQLGLALPLFLFLGLAALSLARLAEIRRQQRERPGAHTNLTRSWMITLIAISGALVLLTLGIEQIFSFQTWLALIAWLKPIWDAILTVLGWIAIGIAFVFYWAFYLVAEGFRALFGGGQPKPSPAQPPGKHPPLPPNGNSGGIPAEWLMAVRFALIALGIALVILLLSRAFRTFAARRRADEADNEERESLGAARLMGAQLRALLAALAARFQRPATEEPRTGEQSGNTIRFLYRRVLQHAAIRGLMRAPAETPREFEQRLEPALRHQQASLPGPAATDADLRAITAAYEQARYGNDEPSAQEVTALGERTERLLNRLNQGQAPQQHV